MTRRELVIANCRALRAAALREARNAETPEEREQFRRYARKYRWDEQWAPMATKRELKKWLEGPTVV